MLFKLVCCNCCIIRYFVLQESRKTNWIAENSNQISITNCIMNLPHNFLLPVNCVVHSYPNLSARFQFHFSHIYFLHNWKIYTRSCWTSAKAKVYLIHTYVSICSVDTNTKYTHTLHTLRSLIFKILKWKVNLAWHWMEFEVQQHVFLLLYCWLALSSVGVLCRTLTIYMQRCLFSRLNNRYITHNVMMINCVVFSEQESSLPPQYSL